MSGFSSVRSAAAPLISQRLPQEKASKPASGFEPGESRKPLVQNHQITVSNSEYDATKTRARPDEDTPTGPPPAFEASLLELETNLEIVIKRVEAAREKARIALAISPEPPWDQDGAQDITQPL
ncbi:MAG: hypothetical protein KUG58_12330 [Marinosulfonomonas sp.]|nr:hypothetical protein [Marinosulfonomonas sp.]